MTQVKIWQIYQHPKLLTILLLGVISGLPLAMVGANFTIWLTESGISKSAIGMLSLLMMPYSLRFLWSPLLDTVTLPNFFKKFDRRLTWIFWLQLATGGFILIASNLTPHSQLVVSSLCIIAISSCSATLDAAIDGYRISIIDDSLQAAAAAMATAGYRLGMLISGGGGLIIAEYHGWQTAYVAMGLVVLASTLILFIAPSGNEAEAVNVGNDGQSFWQMLTEKLINPIKNLMQLDSFWLMLVFIAIFRLSDSFIHTMTSPLLIELGYTKLEIASIVKTLTPIATIIGGIVGGYFCYKTNLRFAMITSGCLMAITNLFFLWLYYQPHNLYFLGVTMVIECFATGIGNTVFVGFVSKCCNRKFAASHYSILTSCALIGRNLLSAPAGIVVDTYGWEYFFIFSTLLAVPGLLMLVFVPKLLTNSN